MFRFEEPSYLYLLILVPLLLALYLYSNWHRRKAIRTFGDPDLMSHLMPEVSKHRPDVKFALLLTAVALFAVLLARPQFGSRLETVKRQGVEVVIALDISNSMLAQDIQPNRLEKAKRLVSQLVDRMENDKVGLIVFAGNAFTQLPITADYISAKMFLESISPSMISRQGTAIGDAIDLALKSFTSQDNVGKTIILITDGENHEAGVDEAMEQARDKGIQVNVLGIGSIEGSPIPADEGNDYRRDEDGQIVITRLNEEMCKQLAQQGNGVYVHVDNTNTAQRAIQDAIDKLAKADVETQVYTDFDEQFQAVAWIILLLLAAEIAIMEKKNPLLRNVHLFTRRAATVAVLLLVAGTTASAQKSERDNLRRGNQQYRDSAYVDAEVSYRKALEANPQSTAAHYNLGNSMLFQNKAQEAMSEYEVAAKTETNRGKLAQIHHNAGVVWQSAKEYARAIEFYKEALRNNPKDNETRYNLALCQKLLKDQQQDGGGQDQQQEQQQQDQQNQQSQQDQQQQEQQQQDQQQQQDDNNMSRENAEQMLRAVMQDERNVQDKVKRQQVQRGSVKLKKDW